LLVYGQFIAEETEALRRLQYDLLLPYGCSGRADEANMTSPRYHALRSSLAPVAVSVALLDRDFVTGQEIAADVCLINDTPQPQAVTAECYLTRENPEFLLNSDFAAQPLFHQTLIDQVPASSVIRRKMSWPLPAQDGTYFLSAVLTAGAEPPVISQRPVRVLDPTATPQALRESLTLVLGADDELRGWLKARGVRYRENLEALAEKPARVLVWDVAKVAPAQRAAARQLLETVRAGGRLVINVVGKWDWRELADFSAGGPYASNAFWAEGVVPPTGLGGECLRRWNGYPDSVAGGAIHGSFAARGRKLMWTLKPERAVLVEVPEGNGHLVLSYLTLSGRLDPASPWYDPVAERVLLYLLSG
jgi:hypothetical protein